VTLDSFGIKIGYPYKKDVVRQKDYCFHKGNFAIIVLTGCDVDGRLFVQLHSTVVILMM
jgi:hypothetical protein